MLGCRGAGKSTFVTKLINCLGIHRQANRGTEETTKKTEFFSITHQVHQLSEHYDEVYIVDQPGVGGLEINEAGYLRSDNFGLLLL